MTAPGQPATKISSAAADTAELQDCHSVCSCGCRQVVENLYLEVSKLRRVIARLQACSCSCADDANACVGG